MTKYRKRTHRRKSRKKTFRRKRGGFRKKSKRRNHRTKSHKKTRRFKQRGGSTRRACAPVSVSVLSPQARQGLQIIGHPAFRYGREPRCDQARAGYGVFVPPAEPAPGPGPKKWGTRKGGQPPIPEPLCCTCPACRREISGE